MYKLTTSANDATEMLNLLRQVNIYLTKCHQKLNLPTFR